MTPNRILATLSLCLVLTAVGARSEKLVVVEYEGPEFEPGTVVDAGDPIRLAAGATLTLMNSSGVMIALSGPFDGPPAAAGAEGDAAEVGLVAAVSSLLRPEEPDAVMGTFRSAAKPGELPPEIWLIDPTASGTHCLPSGAAASIWRADAGEEAALEIFGDDGDEVVWWDEGEQTVDWPAELPLADGAVYEANWQESLESAEITLHRLPVDPMEGAAALPTLVEHGCRRQAFAVLARMVAESVAAEPAAATEPDPPR